MTNEHIHEVALTLLVVGISQFNSFFESWRISIIACKVFHYIGNRNFEDDIHTTLQVKTQTNLQGLAILERLANNGINNHVAH